MATASMTKLPVPLKPDQKIPSPYPKTPPKRNCKGTQKFVIMGAINSTQNWGDKHIWCYIRRLQKKKKEKITQIYFTVEKKFPTCQRPLTHKLSESMWPTNQLTGAKVRYSFSVIDLMPFGSGSTSSSMSSLGGKPRVRPSSHWSMTPQSIAYLIARSKYSLSVMRCGWTVNILIRPESMIQTELSKSGIFRRR